MSQFSAAFPDRRRHEMTMHPRKVRSGSKLSSKDGSLPQHWASQRWVRLIEQAASGEALTEGLEYAKMGQARKLEIGAGRIESPVQGRARASYQTALTLPTFDASDWERVVASMSDQALYAAKLLAGELPQNIEDLFAPFGLHLFPNDPSELTVTCTCHRMAWRREQDLAAREAARKENAEAAERARERGEPIPPPKTVPVDPVPEPEGPVEGEGTFCKHSICLLALVADRLAADPFLIFALRGLPGEELVERLRQRRQLAGAVGGSTPVYSPHLSEGGSNDAEDGLGFWDASEELERLDTPVDRPEVKHPLLRRLGRSPFPEGRFPMVGLLATCYDVIAEDASRD
ncbi:MAG: hypothetical protein AAF747_06375, partial [Planctomycetota bacterium]